MPSEDCWKESLKCIENLNLWKYRWRSNIKSASSRHSFGYILNLVKNNGFLIRHLKKFLTKKCKFQVLDEEIKAIFSRMDKDQDGLVSCEDFALTMLPLHIDKQDQINWMKNMLENMENKTCCSSKTSVACNSEHLRYKRNRNNSKFD